MIRFDAVIVLGIDTSTAAGSVALARDEQIAGMEVSTTESHSTWLLKAIHTLLDRTAISLQLIDGIAVVVGPGSFTGLRIGMTTAKGLAAAGHKPCAGVVSLEAMAATMAQHRPDALLVPAIDARKGEVYFGIYRLVKDKAPRLK